MKAILCFLMALTAAAAPLERDLGLGLAYCRVHRLPADLPVTLAAKKPRAIVLDLRWTESDIAGASALDAWLKIRASATSPVLLLVNPATPAILTRTLANRPSAAGLLAIGTATADFLPDLAVVTTPESERTAYDALENGTPVGVLLSDTPEKIRHDEAELVQQHREPPPAPVAPERPEPAELKKTAPPPPPPPPPVDRALQRAVQLHRALVALRQLPSG